MPNSIRVCHMKAKYYYADKQGRIYVLDVLTGESTLFCDELQYTHPDGTVRFSGQGAMYVVSGHLMAERTTPQEMPEYASKPIRLFAIPLEGGPASEILLSDFYHTYDNPLKVRAETPAGLIVVGRQGQHHLCRHRQRRQPLLRRRQ